MPVDSSCLQYDMMATSGSWDLLTDLLGGTPAMRAAGKKWLPKEPDEKDRKYQVRLGRSFLKNAFKDTIEKYVARPFSRPARWDVKGYDEAKSALDPIMSNIDGEGLHHQSFARELFRNLLTWGVSSAFVDYTTIEEAQERTRADDEVLGARPISRVLKTPSVIGWRTIESDNGVEKLVEIRIRESYIEHGSDWSQTPYEQVRVIRADSWELWSRELKNERDKGEYVVDDEGVYLVAGSVPSDIPIVTAYCEKIGTLVSLPPFFDLAWTNLEDWQSRSDQKNILRFDRFGILMGSGFTADEIKAGLVVAPTQAVMSENPEAKLGRVETNGKPAENGWKDLDDIAERLEVLGMAPMISRMANVKATGIAANESKSRSQIESWIDSANLAMRQIMQLNLKWMGFDVPIEAIEYNIYQDFVFSTQQSQEVKDVIETRKLGEISHETFIKELQRYGRLSDTVNATEERAKIASEQGFGIGMFGERGMGLQGLPGMQPGVKT